MEKYLRWALLAACGALWANGCGGTVTQGGGAGGEGAASTTGATGSGGTGCTSDKDCAAGEQWCVGGACIPCDNGGLVCDIACIAGWTTYERNGCFPCACAPINECTTDADCPNSPGQCYAGQFCWDWCAPGDPSCCYGNQCSQPGCSGPHPAGCFSTGCPADQQCTATGCSPSSCGCDGADWVCTDDCGGGTCTP